MAWSQSRVSFAHWLLRRYFYCRGLPWRRLSGGGRLLEELCRAGVKRIVRVGSAGGLQPSILAGSVVIARAAVREDGLSPKLVPPSYPAVATEELVIALRDAAASVSAKVHEGIVLTSDLFYPGEALGSDLSLWQRAGVTAVEMEIATLLSYADCMVLRQQPSLPSTVTRSNRMVAR